MQINTKNFERIVWNNTLGLNRLSYIIQFKVNIIIIIDEFKEEQSDKKKPHPSTQRSNYVDTKFKSKS